MPAFFVKFLSQKSIVKDAPKDINSDINSDIESDLIDDHTGTVEQTDAEGETCYSV